MSSLGAQTSPLSCFVAPAPLSVRRRHSVNIWQMSGTHVDGNQDAILTSPRVRSACQALSGRSFDRRPLQDKAGEMAGDFHP